MAKFCWLKSCSLLEKACKLVSLSTEACKRASLRWDGSISPWSVHPSINIWECVRASVHGMHARGPIDRFLSLIALAV
jgi:hypothetical protein